MPYSLAGLEGAVGEQRSQVARPRVVLGDGVEVVNKQFAQAVVFVEKGDDTLDVFAGQRQPEQVRHARGGFGVGGGQDAARFQ